MARPRYRKPRQSLSAEDRIRLVGMRDQGATWMKIGCAFGLQDSYCRRIYQQAKPAAVTAEPDAAAAP